MTPKFKPDELQESDLGGKQLGTEILIPISDIWSWLKNKFRKPPPEKDDNTLNIEELEKIRQNKIDEIIDKEMAEVCNEDPKMREKLRNT